MNSSSGARHLLWSLVEKEEDSEFATLNSVERFLDYVLFSVVLPSDISNETLLRRFVSRMLLDCSSDSIHFSYESFCLLLRNVFFYYRRRVGEDFLESDSGVPRPSFEEEERDFLRRLFLGISIRTRVEGQAVATSYVPPPPAPTPSSSDVEVSSGGDADPEDDDYDASLPFLSHLHPEVLALLGLTRSTLMTTSWKTILYSPGFSQLESSFHSFPFDESRWTEYVSGRPQDSQSQSQEADQIFRFEFALRAWVDGGGGGGEEVEEEGEEEKGLAWEGVHPVFANLTPLDLLDLFGVSKVEVMSDPLLGEKIVREWQDRFRLSCCKGPARDWIDARMRQSASFLVFGPPRSGKMSLAKRIAEHYNSYLIDVDGVLNEHIWKQSKIGNRLRVMAEKTGQRQLEDAAYLEAEGEGEGEGEEEGEGGRPARKVPVVDLGSTMMITNPDTGEKEEVERPKYDSVKYEISPPHPPFLPVIPPDLRTTIVRNLLESRKVAHRGYVLTVSEYESNPVIEDLIRTRMLPRTIVILDFEDEDEESEMERVETVLADEQQRIEELENELLETQARIDAAWMKRERQRVRNEERDVRLKMEEDGVEDILEPEDDFDEEEGEGEEEEEEEEEGEDGEMIPRKRKPTLKEDILTKKNLLFELCLLRQRHSNQESLRDALGDLSDVVKKLRETCPRRVIRINAAQSEETIFRSVVETLHKTSPTPLPRRLLELQDDEEEVDLDEEVAEESLRVAQESGVVISPIWKRVCPVAYTDSFVTREGTAIHAVIYRQVVYFLSSFDAAKEFLKNPEEFVGVRPRTRKKIMVVGRPMEKEKSLEVVASLASSIGCRSYSLDFFLSNGPRQSRDRDRDLEEEEDVEEEGEEGSGRKIPIRKRPFTRPKRMHRARMLTVVPDFDSDGAGIVECVVYNPATLKKLFSSRVYPDHVLLIEKEEDEDAEEGEGETDVEVEGETEDDEEEPPADAPKRSSRSSKRHRKKKKVVYDPMKDKTFLNDENYALHIEELAGQLEELGLPLARIPYTEKTWDISVMLHQIRSEVDSFHVVPTRIEGAAEEDEDEGDKRLGLVGTYCIVTLKLKGVLQTGSPEFALEHENLTYWFAGEDQLALFESNPDRFVLGVDLPPPRVWVFGIPSSGKTTVSSWLSKEFDMPSISFERPAVIKAAEDCGADGVLKIFEDEEDRKRLEAEQKEAERDGEDSDEYDEVEEEGEGLGEEMEVLLAAFKELLKNPPYSTKGFVLDGVEDTAISPLLDFAAPELAVSVQIDEKTYVSRNVKQLIADYKAKMLAKVFASEAKVRERKMKMRLQKPFAQDEDEDSDEEFDEEEDSEEEEDETILKERVIEDYATHLEAVKGVLDVLSESLVEVVEVLGNSPLRLISRTLRGQMSPFTVARDSLFFRREQLTHDEALVALSEGTRTLNFRFGYDDCVDMANSRKEGRYFRRTLNVHNLEHPPEVKQYLAELATEKEGEEDYDTSDSEDSDMEESQKKKKMIIPELSFPACLQDELYFFQTDKNRDTFLRNPGPIISQEVYPLHSLQPKIALLEESPNESFCLNLAKSLGLVVVSLSEDEIEEEDDDVLRLVRNRLSSSECTHRGFVLRGLPATVEQAEALESSGVVFHRVVVVLGESPGAHRDDLIRLCTYYQRKRHNTILFDNAVEQLSAWNKIVVVKKSIDRKLSAITRRRIAVSRRLAVSIHDLGIDIDVFRRGLSRFETFCPVTLVSENSLVNMEGDFDHRWGVEYLSKFYCLAGEREFEQFVQHPGEYLSARHQLPSHLPEIMAKKPEKAEKFAVDGYCPVCLKTFCGPLRRIVEGKDEFAIRYKDEAFRLCSPCCRDKFWRQPWLFADAVLPVKLPVTDLSIVRSLDEVGYLTETVKRLLERGLYEVQKKRPLFPGLDPRRSALRFLSLFLRANNDFNKTDRQERAEEDLDVFSRMCDLPLRLGQVQDEEEKEELLEFWSKNSRNVGLNFF